MDMSQPDMCVTVNVTRERCGVEKETTSRRGKFEQVGVLKDAETNTTILLTSARLGLKL